MARRRSTSRRSRLGFVSILLLLGVLSLVEFLETGTLQWPGKLAPVAEELLADAVQAPGAEPAANPSAPASPTSATTPIDAALTGQAVNITDGDTFTLRYSSLEEERVRLHGIDAPERNQPHGPAAGAELARLIEGREVRVELVDRDNYGRLVARVWIGDIDINLALVEAGHAWWYEYYAQDRRDLELAEEAARRAQLGLWAQRNPVPPWEWRRNRR
jgi:endonuclease YncB( thermonuclease family)